MFKTEFFLGIVMFAIFSHFLLGQWHFYMERKDRNDIANVISKFQTWMCFLLLIY